MRDIDSYDVRQRVDGEPRLIAPAIIGLLIGAATTILMIILFSL